MPTCHIDQRAIITVAGPEAEHFLQNVITTDLDALAEGEVRPGALLTPQGKILFDFLISRAGSDTLRLECRADIASELAKRLMLYRLRAKAEIIAKEQQIVAVSWGEDSNAAKTGSALADRRFPDKARVGRHHASPPEANADPADWHALRIAHAVAESGTDYQLGDAFPHDVLLEQNGGVGLKKGCYVGQEVVSRMQHRGTARRRLLIASGQDPLPASGTELTVEGRTVGALGTVVGNAALAIARIDRVKEAMDASKPVLAGEVPVSLAIPSWATFTFPETERQPGGDAG